MSTPNRSHPDYKHIIGSSDLGRCLKATVAEMLGYQAMMPTDAQQGMYDRGHEHEEACLAAMHAENWNITDRQQEHVLPVLDGWGVIVHPDAIGKHPFLTADKPRVVEVKSPATWERFEKAVRTADYSDPYMHRIAWQVSCQMHATGLEAYVTSWDEERGVRGFGIEVAPFTMDDIIIRVGNIAGFVYNGDLPATCSSADWPCPFYYLHEDAEEVTEDAYLDMLVSQYDQASAMAKSCEETKKQVQAEIRAHLAGRDTVTQQSKVTFYEQAAPTRYDYDKLRAVLDSYGGPTLDDFVIPGKSSERMKITRRDSE